MKKEECGQEEQQDKVNNKKACKIYFFNFFFEPSKGEKSLT